MSLSPKQKTQAIVDRLSTDLPSLITGAGLVDFDSYQTKSPKIADSNILSAYIMADDDLTDNEVFGVMIHCQIYSPAKGTDEQDYHDVIFPYLRENLTSDIVDMAYMDKITSDLFPAERMGGTCYVFYQVAFAGTLDDCN